MSCYHALVSREGSGGCTAQVGVVWIRTQIPRRVVHCQAAGGMKTAFGSHAVAAVVSGGEGAADAVPVRSSPMRPSTAPFWSALALMLLHDLAAAFDDDADSFRPR